MSHFSEMQVEMEIKKIWTSYFVQRDIILLKLLAAKFLMITYTLRPLDL